MSSLSPRPLTGGSPSALARAAGILLTVALGLFAVAPVVAEPGAGQPLQLIRGEVCHVAGVSQLKATLERANAVRRPATLLLADGTYVLDIPALDIQCPGLVIRSASGRREAVVVRGPDEGPHASVADVFLVSTNDVVIADLTLGYCRFHGIQVRGEEPYNVSGLRVHNCRLVNCNQQFIKGSSSEDDPVGATGGCIEQCLFEFTSGWAYQSYTGGIDIHKGVNWVVRDNLFRNLRTTRDQPGLAEHAIHFWKRCPTLPQNILVERNWIVNCDRGIGFGLSNAAGGHNGGASTIRNNMIFNDGTGPHTDVGIGLEAASNVQVDNNSVVIETYWAPIEYRFAGSSNLIFRNNLVNRPIQRRDAAPQAAKTNNIERIEAAWFRDLPAGDLRLAPAATLVIAAGQPLPGFNDDVDGQPRPGGAAWSIGAFQGTRVPGAGSSSNLNAPLGSEKQPPYPRSQLIASLDWHWDTLTTAAPGSDLWPIAWGPDDHLYAAWGDGGGFGGSDSDGRVALGFARIEGTPPNWRGVNINGGKNPEHPASFARKGKTAGLAFVDGVLYATVNLQDGPWPDVNHVLAWSTDLAATWTQAPWLFARGAGHFQPAQFLSFGKDYTGLPRSLDGYVYLYGPKQSTESGGGQALYLARVPRAKLREQAAYEFFLRADAAGPAEWVAHSSQASPVFIDPNGVSPGGVVYDAPLRRFLLTSYHAGPGQLGVFEAPNPWGPWRTIAYHEDWGGMGAKGEGLTCSFPPKWISADGLTLWCVFSVYGEGAKAGIQAHDRFNLLQASLQLFVQGPEIDAQPVTRP